MVKVGQKVRYVPRFLEEEKYSPNGQKPVPVIGTVIFANPDNEFFLTEYDMNGTKLREGFKFSDIGRAVHLIE